MSKDRRRHRPAPGQPRTVRKTENVEVTFGSEGLRSVVPIHDKPTTGGGEFGEPCYGCDCCLKWTETLELLRGHVIAHNERVPALFPCPGDCLVCASTSWTGETPG